jgi:hypothetical protein
MMIVSIFYGWFFAWLGSQLHGKRAMMPKDIDARDIGANHRSKNSGL